MIDDVVDGGGCRSRDMTEYAPAYSRSKYTRLAVQSVNEHDGGDDKHHDVHHSPSRPASSSVQDSTSDQASEY